MWRSAAILGFGNTHFGYMVVKQFSCHVVLKMLFQSDSWFESYRRSGIFETLAAISLCRLVWRWFYEPLNIKGGLHKSQVTLTVR